MRERSERVLVFCSLSSSQSVLLRLFFFFSFFFEVFRRFAILEIFTFFFLLLASSFRVFGEKRNFAPPAARSHRVIADRERDREREKRTTVRDEP